MLRHFGISWRARSVADAEAPLLEWSQDEDGSKESPQSWQSLPAVTRRRSLPVAVPPRKVGTLDPHVGLEQAASPPLIDLPPGLLHDRSEESSGRLSGSASNSSKPALATANQGPANPPLEDFFHGQQPTGDWLSSDPAVGQQRQKLQSMIGGHQILSTQFQDHSFAARATQQSSTGVESAAAYNQPPKHLASLTSGGMFQQNQSRALESTQRGMIRGSEVLPPGEWWLVSAQAGGCEQGNPNLLARVESELPVSMAATDAPDSPACPEGAWQFRVAHKLQGPHQLLRRSDNEAHQANVLPGVGEMASKDAWAATRSPRSLVGGRCRSEAGLSIGTDGSGPSLPGSSRTRSDYSRLGPFSKPTDPQAAKGAHSPMPYWPGACYAPAMHPHMLWPPHVERVSTAVRQWRQTVKWLLLWLALSCLTILHSLALVLSLGYSLFATISAALFTWSGVLGILGAARALLGLCLARHKPPEDALQSLQLKAVEMLAFTTGMLSASAAVIHLVCIQILMHDSHLPACAPGDSRCAEGYNMIVVIMVATAVLYTCHAAVSGIVAYSARAAKCLASASAGFAYQDVPGSPLRGAGAGSWD